MRRMKFRVWDETKKEMLFRYGIFNEEPGTETSVFAQYESTPKYHGVKVMQFTGLKDSKGKEIYEGDILDLIVIRGEECGSSVVTFAAGCFGLDFPNYRPCLYEVDDRYVQIVGNIYENSEGENGTT